MNRIKNVLLGNLCVLLVAIYITGCLPLLSEGVQFNNEVQLEQEGFVAKLNQEVDLGDEKVVFQKVAFDKNSITFVYKGGNIQLSGSSIVIKGIEGEKPQKVLEHIDESTVNFGTTITGNDYHVVTVPHNLELINQPLLIEINLNGKDNKFSVDFPGEQIALATCDVMVDSTGRVVNEGAKAVDRVIVGIGSTVMETKGDNRFIIVDKEARKVLGHSQKLLTSEEAITIFDPVSLPRKHVEIKILTEEKTVLISY